MAENIKFYATANKLQQLIEVKLKICSVYRKSF